ncbi:DUF2513 domain-containing protein [Paenibacillus crassostreae]|uniref:DUF2513 domain-containing protein n=1 Tax=Paenibacillus crassostreae TaxID=1763538 RepID=A0A167AV07_9BACL|nr:DUF2513 domain-containing protein [Paenibacillus crassostreae]AOZ93638.1 hypothetical protein LPB68_16515 [Paenibacillus crassostreae]OAB71465.1 hypothetical protein PNBC_19385 [Paenibacillus crassostreae]
MKRDLDIIIQVLKYIEEHNTATNTIVVELEEYETEEEKENVQYQVQLLREAGYIEAKATLSPYQFYVKTMTWKGHDFLDAARDQSVVEKAKDLVKRKGLEFSTLPIDIAKDYLVHTLKSMIGL